MVQPLWKTVWKFLKKLKIELPYDLVIPLLGIYLKKKKPKTLTQKDTCIPMFIVALFTIAKIRKQPKCSSTDEWINIYIIYKRMKFAATWMDLEGIILSEISQTEKDKYCMISLMCGI